MFRTLGNILYCWAVLWSRSSPFFGWSRSRKKGAAPAQTPAPALTTGNIERNEIKQFF